MEIAPILPLTCHSFWANADRITLVIAGSIPANLVPVVARLANAGRTTTFHVICLVIYLSPLLFKEKNHG